MLGAIGEVETRTLALETRGFMRPGRTTVLRVPRDGPGQRLGRAIMLAGVIVIGIGVFFLLGQFVPDVGRWIPLFIGLAFLAAFMAKREYGFLIPGCIVSGVGVGIVLEGLVDDPWSGAAP